MATERLSMRKTREILRQKWELGRTHREIAASVGLSLGAVAETLGRAAAAGVDWAAVQALADAALEERLYGARPSSALVRAMPDFEYLHAERKKPGVTLQLLHLEYLEKHAARATSDGRVAVSCDSLQAADRVLSFTGLAVGDGQHVGLRILDAEVPRGTSFLVYVNYPAVVR